MACVCEHDRQDEGDIKKYILWYFVSNNFYSNYTSSFTLTVALWDEWATRLRQRKTSPDIAYISSAHLSCHRLIYEHTHFSFLES